METTAILNGIKAAGFKMDSTSNRLNMVNDLGVGISEFLSAIGFVSNEVKQTNRTWVEWTKYGVNFKVNYRNVSEFTPAYATVDFI